MMKSDHFSAFRDKASWFCINIQFLTDKAKDFIIEKGYNPKYGARPLERAIQKHVEDVLAEEILSGKVKKGDLVLADFDKKNNVIKITKLDPKKNKQKSK